MKKICLLFIVTIFFIVGCNTNNPASSTKLQDYDNTDLKVKLKDVPFQPKLPTKIPFNVTKTTTEFSRDDNMSSISISFDGPGKGKRGTHLDLIIVRDGDEPVPYRDGIDVNIGKTKGKYLEWIDRGREVEWMEDGFHYHINYYFSRSDTVFTKEDLIKMAESFE